MAQGLPLTDQELTKTVRLYREGTITSTAKSLGLDRKSVRERLEKAQARGLIEPIEFRPNAAKFANLNDIIVKQKTQFQRLVKSGNWTTPHKIKLEDDGAFVLIALGDPHINSKWFDRDAWDYWTGLIDIDNRVRSVCVGDWTDNWKHTLQHLWAGTDTQPTEDWVVLEAELKRLADHLDAAIGGNHDGSWSRERDMCAAIMQQHSILYRDNGLFLCYDTPGKAKDRPQVNVAIRHEFKGHSQWNAAHGVAKAAQMGIHADILMAGHKHVNGETIKVAPLTGQIMHCHQLGAFKVYDDYADEAGFSPEHISPATAFVIQPQLSSNNPNRITRFYDPHMAIKFMETLI